MTRQRIAVGHLIPSLVELAFEAGAAEGMAELRPRVDAYLSHGSLECLVEARALVRRVCLWLGDSGLDWTDAHAPLTELLAQCEERVLEAKIR